MRVLREASSNRLRASLRGVIPAVVTLAVFLGGRAVLRAIFPLHGTTTSLGETVLLRGLLFALYVVMVWLAIRLASALDRRHYAAYGVRVDGAWLRQFAAGVGFSVAGIGLSLSWGVLRGFRSVNASVDVSSPDGSAYVALALVAYVLFLLLGNVYEEVVYRGVMLQNFAEGLHARGFPPTLAVVPATAASLGLFGLYHFPLRGTFLVTVDAAVVGVTFALAYVLTGDLGLPIGVHFGRTAFELLTGFEVLGVTVPPVVEITRNTLAANLEVRLLEIGAVCLFVLAWAARTDGGIGLAETVYEPTDG